MKRGLTGHFETTMMIGEPVRAFVTAPLPPNPPVEMSADRQRRHDRALIACGRLDAITALLPDPDLFLYAYVRREAVLSSQIEGTQSLLSDLLLFELDEALACLSTTWSRFPTTSPHLNTASSAWPKAFHYPTIQPPAARNPCSAAFPWTRRRKATRRVSPQPKLDRRYAPR